MAARQASGRAALIAPWLRAAPVEDPLGAVIILPEPGYLHAERIDAIRQIEQGVRLMGLRITSLDTD